MIPHPYRINFDTLNQAFSDGAACLLECNERTTGRPVYVICAVNHRRDDFEFVPFGTLFNDSLYELLSPPADSAPKRSSV